jgi:hypothetical protein
LLERQDRNPIAVTDAPTARTAIPGTTSIGSPHWGEVNRIAAFGAPSNIRWLPTVAVAAPLDNATVVKAV